MNILGPDASGRPFAELLRGAAIMLAASGGGSLSDCLTQKADEIDAAREWQTEARDLALALSRDLIERKQYDLAEVAKHIAWLLYKTTLETERKAEGDQEYSGGDWGIS